MRIAKLSSRSLAAVALMSFAKAARAQDDSAHAAAIELFDTAERLKTEGHLSEACPKYGESYRLDPQLGALLHFAECLEQDGKLASSYAAYRDAVEVATRKGDSRRGVAERRAAALQPRLSRITVDVALAARAMPGLEVRRDGVLLSAEGWGTALPVDAGEHVIIARADGREPWQIKVSVVDGAAERVEVPELRATGAALAPAPEPKPLPPPPPAAIQIAPVPAPLPEVRRSRNLTPGILALGVGVVGIAVGTYFTIKTSDLLKRRDAICPSGSDCEPGTNARLAEITDHARTTRIAGVAGFAAGGAAAAAGIALLVLAPSHAESEPKAARVLPLLGPGTAGFVFEGRL